MILSVQWRGGEEAQIQVHKTSSNALRPGLRALKSPDPSTVSSVQCTLRTAWGQSDSLLSISAVQIYRHVWLDRVPEVFLSQGGPRASRD